MEHIRLTAISLSLPFRFTQTTVRRFDVLIHLFCSYCLDVYKRQDDDHCNPAHVWNFSFLVCP